MTYKHSKTENAGFKYIISVAVEDYENRDDRDNTTGGKSDGEGLAKKMGSVSERKAHVHLSERQFQTENSVVRGNILHHTDGHGPRGVQ